MQNLFALFLAFLPQTPAAPPSAPKAAENAPTLLDKVAILGASLTEGYGLQAELGAPVWMGDVLRAAAKRDLAAPERESSLLFFADPRGVGAKSAKDAREKQPTFVLALDFLFWFGYGEFATPEKRLESFDFGLAQLAPFTCPLLVGDLPDMSSALGGKPQMLQPTQVPDAAALAAMNERLRAWATQHENVVVFPLGELSAKLRSGKELVLRGNTIFPSELPELFQSDLLHPKAMGTIVVWLAAADALVRARRDVPATWFEWDRQQIYRRLYAAQEPERKKQREKKQKEWERDHPAPPPPQPTPEEKRQAEEKQRRSGGG